MIKYIALLVALLVLSKESCAGMILSVADIKVADDVSTVLTKVESLKESESGSSYNKKCGYGDIRKEYKGGSLAVTLLNKKVAHISYSKRIPGSKHDIELSIINKYGKPIEIVRKDWGQIDLIYSRESQNSVSIQNFNSKDPKEGIYITLALKDSDLQLLYREKDECERNQQIQTANPTVIPDL